MKPKISAIHKVTDFTSQWLSNDTSANTTQPISLYLCPPFRHQRPGVSHIKTADPSHDQTQLKSKSVRLNQRSRNQPTLERALKHSSQKTNGQISYLFLKTSLLVFVNVDDFGKHLRCLWMLKAFHTFWENTELGQAVTSWVVLWGDGDEGV